MRQFRLFFVGVLIVAGCSDDSPVPTRNKMQPPPPPPVTNTLPELASVSIGGGPYQTNDTINATWEGSDAEDGQNVTPNFQWYVSGAPVAGATLGSLAGTAFEKGDEVYVQVTLRDSEGGESLPVNSNTVTIANTPPTFTEVIIDGGPFLETSVLTAVPNGWEDADGDLPGFRHRWYVNGVAVPAATESIDGVHFNSGDAVTVTTIAFDGTAEGSQVTSEPAVVGNTPPSLASADIGTGPYRTDDLITVTTGAVTDADGHATTLSYRWFVAGSEVSDENGESLSGVHFSKGQTVAVEVTPHDLQSAGQPVWSNVVTIKNSPPVLASADIGEGPYYKSSTITVSPGPTTDADLGDEVSFGYRWFVNGDEVFGETDNRLSGAYFRGRQTVHAEVTPHDDAAAGTPVLSNFVTIENSGPSAAGISIEPEELTGSAGLWVKIQSPATDPDEDTVSYYYEWYKDGERQPYPNDATLVPSGDYAYGEIWKVVVTASDLFGLSATSHTSRDIIYSRAKQVAAGHDYTCVLTVVGGVQCWGANAWGQLGIGATGGYAMAPTDVVGLSSAVAAIAVGGGHTCALMTTGGVKCWGNNNYGQTGNGSSGGNVLTSTDVSGLASGVAAIAAGANHTCALTTAGGVKCWGNNDSGQLGTDSRGGNELSPKDVVGLTSGVTAITAGSSHTCALTAVGGVKCWGGNGNGELGTGSNGGYALTPTNVVGLTSGVEAITAGASFTCALTTDSGVKCWGNNFYGQIGTGTRGGNILTPTDVAGLTSGVAAITAGSYHTCALMTTGGGGKCWGDNNHGQIGTGKSRDLVLTAINVDGLFSGVVAISTGHRHTCALTTGGGVECWGYNHQGQTGTGTGGDIVNTPADVNGSTSGVAAIAAGFKHTCSLTTAGGVKCWGANGNGELGIGGSGDVYSPMDVVGLTSGAAAISVKHSHTCALSVDVGGVKCWGQNFNGQVGTGKSGEHAFSPTDVTGVTSGVVAIATGTGHTCALTTAGGVKCWGNNGNGQLGTGSSGGNVLAPADVVGLTSGVVAIAAGAAHTCALTTGGGVKCWGYNVNAEVGNGSSGSDVPTPTDVVGLTSGVAAITAGHHHTCALMSTDGRVKCWGENSNGQIGTGTSGSDVLAPADVSGLSSGVSAITAGFSHTCALTNVGGVKCWGGNSFAQIGMGTSGGNVLTPTDPLGLTSSVAAISAGYYHNCALTTGGGVMCWGQNTSGQSGNLVIVVPERVVGY